ncbi:MAG: hypothetical protein K6G61_10480 [Solobacterium sp.]|nr:hypothetical protein [Solobacterium sp.]
MRKRAVLTAALSLVLSGCTTKYEKKDIEKYVRDLTGSIFFIVSDTPEDITGEDGYTDHLWTVQEPGGIEYRVLDNYYWGMEAMTNSLYTDRDYVLAKRYFESKGHRDLVLEETVDERMLQVQAAGTFTDREGLRQLTDEMNELMQDAEEGISLRCTFRFDHPSRYIGDYVQDDGDYRGAGSAGKEISCREAEACWLHQIIDMRYEEQLAAFTEEEIRACVEGNTNQIGIVSEDSTVEFQPDLLASRMMYGISFGTFLELLRRTGYPVEGDRKQFTFTGTDGSEYTFSDSFRKDGAYYYLKDGETVFTEYYFYNHLEPKFVETISGIRYLEYWQTKAVEN